MPTHTVLAAFWLYKVDHITCSDIGRAFGYNHGRKQITDLDDLHWRNRTNKRNNRHHDWARLEGSEELCCDD